MLKKSMERQINPAANGVCDAAYLELGKGIFPQKTVTNCLKRIASNPITYENAFPPIKWALILQRQVKYVEDIIVTRDTANLGVSSRDVIQTISDIVQASSHIKAENHLNSLIWDNQLSNMTRYGRVIKSQATTTEQSHIFVSQQYRWHMTIEAGWEGLRRTNSPRDIFTCFDHYFQLNLD